MNKKIISLKFLGILIAVLMVAALVVCSMVMPGTVDDVAAPTALLSNEVNLVNGIEYPIPPPAYSAEVASPEIFNYDMVAVLIITITTGTVVATTILLYGIKRNLYGFSGALMGRRRTKFILPA